MKPKDFFFVLLGLIVVLLGAGGYGFYTALGYVKTQSNTLATERAVQQAAEQQILAMIKLNEEYHKKIVPILPLINDALPRQKNQTEILAQIERLAAHNGMQVNAVTMPAPAGVPSSISQTIKAGEVLALPINFAVEGSYGQLQTFTAQLENLNRFTNITSLAIQDKGSGNAVYAFELNAYIKP